MQSLSVKAGKGHPPVLFQGLLEGAAGAVWPSNDWRLETSLDTQKNRLTPEDKLAVRREKQGRRRLKRCSESSRKLARIQPMNCFHHVFKISVEMLSGYGCVSRC